MTTIQDIIQAAAHSPELALEMTEAYLEPLTGPIPMERDTVASWVNASAAVFNLLRYVQLARYYPGGHERIDLLKKADALMPERKPIDLEA